MFCKQCGRELSPDARFCLHCGAPTSAATNISGQTPPDPLHTRLLPLLNDKLFLAICILVSVSFGLGLLGGTIEVLSLLFTIFLWILFSKGRKNEISVKQMRCVSGTLFAGFVVQIVGGSAAIFGGLMCAVAFLALDIGASWDMLVEEVESLGGTLTLDLPSFMTDSVLWLWLMVLIILVAGAVMLAAAILLNKRIHSYAKTLYMSANTGLQELPPVRTAAVCMVISGSLQAVSAAFNLLNGNFLGCIPPCCIALCMFFGRTLILKYLDTK